MHIIEYSNYEIHPTQEAFLIKPIRELYNEDKSKFKETFMQQMSILYFLADPRSSYNYISDEKDRLEEILIQEGLPSDYKISEKLEKAIEIYRKHVKTPSSMLLEDSIVAVDKVRKFLKDVDLNEVDDKGKPKYTINSITTALSQVSKIAKEIVDTERIVAQEIEEAGKIRGNSEKTLTDDGIKGFMNL